ncbi:hypothetical protein GCM10009574_074890 [Streptomyces asiaticus]|uniref:Uncharacterized protein n=2 Tax=Streptomyces rhizosphaericus TaxID=114699 RepID=A0ABP4CRL4_9ACTN
MQRGQLLHALHLAADSRSAGTSTTIGPPEHCITSQIRDVPGEIYARLLHTAPRSEPADLRRCSVALLPPFRGAGATDP